MLACGEAPPPAPAPRAVKAAPPPLRFGDWRSTSFGSYIAPEDRIDDRFDLIFHFHVGRSAEAEYKGSGIRAVVMTATHGLFASAYSDTYDSGERFPNALAEITALVRARTGRPTVAIGRIALVAWSAGYGAVRKVLLRTPSDAIDAVVLLDGLHTAYRDTPEGRTVDLHDLDPFVRFAREAAAGKKLMVVTHSSIVPYGYPGTTETTTALLKAVGVERVTVPEAGPGEAGLTLTSRADHGDFHVRGYAGEDKGAHVGQLHLIEGILRDYLRPRWAKGS